MNPPDENFQQIIERASQAAAALQESILAAQAAAAETETAETAVRETVIGASNTTETLTAGYIEQPAPQPVEQEGPRLSRTVEGPFGRIVLG